MEYTNDADLTCPTVSKHALQQTSQKRICLTYKVISVEKDPQHLSFISQVMREVKTDKCFPVRADAFKFIEKCSEQFDFIFADPPYALKDLQSIPGRIFENGLLKENGLLVLEHGKDQNFEDDPHFIERRIYGSVNFSFFRATVPEAE